MTGRELASLRQRWTAYGKLTSLTDHWYWRPGWRADRQFYTWHLTFDDQPDLHDLVSQLQRQLALPGLDLVPLDGLHLTMQGLGFTDEVSDADVADIVAVARDRCATLPPMRLTLGPVDADAEGIGLLVQPWDQVERLRCAVREAIGEVWEEVPEPAEGFRPHVTIAYSGSPAPIAPIRNQLAELRHLPPVGTTVRHVTLIALRREAHTYRWTTIAMLPLQG
ncbi:2'-5' RNA ligase family protein [Micromonospora sp. NPDC002389]|uniref:2'-5' RNA ligase family protein n=1 Tax=Micromonospora sp. NPDC002389 TaxID=3154272 RepID=UPI003326C8BB